MQESISFVGLDVHSETITCAVVGPNGELLDLGTFPCTEASVRRLVKKLKKYEPYKVCYETGPTGYALYWSLHRLGVACEVVATSLIPKRSGDRVKTDRRDARMLARLYRAGELTPVWVPDEEHEAFRELVRCREKAVGDRTRARNRVGKLLLRRGLRRDGAGRKWTKTYRLWLSSLRFEHQAVEVTFADLLHEIDHTDARVERLAEAIDTVIAQSSEVRREQVQALQALSGVGKVGSITLMAELGNLSRFPHPRNLMGYIGVVPSEYSSAKRVSRGGITKTGNSHVRRVLVEGMWSIVRGPGARPPARKGPTVSPAVEEIARKAQTRLRNRYCRMRAAGKEPNVIVVALARELLGFVWAIGVEVEKQHAKAAA